MKSFKILKFELKNSKKESRKFTVFQTNQYGKQNSNLSNVLLMRHESFSKVSQSVFYYP